MQPTPAVDTVITPLFKKTRKRPAQYIIDIDLLDAPLSIHRRLSIPSNMNLGYVQEILMLANGLGRTLTHTTSAIVLPKPESTTSNAPSAKPDGDSIENSL